VLIVIIFSLYAAGIILYLISKKWFRTTLWMIASIVAIPYLIIVLGTSAPTGAGHDPYAGFGLGLLLIFASLSGLPSVGFLSAGLAAKLYKSSSKTALRIIYASLALAIFPSLLLYLFEIAPASRMAKITATHLEGHYAVKLGDRYLDLPCRREFHLFRPARDCVLEKPKNHLDFNEVRTLKIWPNGHADRHNGCAKTALDKSKIARFCDVKFLPYNVNFIGNKIDRDRMALQQLRRLEAIEGTSIQTLGNLKIIKKTETSYSNDRPATIKYQFRKDNDGSIAHLFCYNSSQKQTNFECNMEIDFEEMVWATALRFETTLDQVEAQVDHITSEVVAYYEQIIETYGISQSTLK